MNQNVNGKAVAAAIVALIAFAAWRAYASLPRTLQLNATTTAGSARVSYETRSGTVSETVQTPWTKVIEAPRGRALTFSVAGDGATCEVLENGARLARLEGGHVHCAVSP